jgi:hypothetical protein
MRLRVTGASSKQVGRMFRPDLDLTRLTGFSDLQPVVGGSERRAQHPGSRMAPGFGSESRETLRPLQGTRLLVERRHASRRRPSREVRNSLCHGLGRGVEDSREDFKRDQVLSLLLYLRGCKLGGWNWRPNKRVIGRWMAGKGLGFGGGGHKEIVNNCRKDWRIMKQRSL